MNENLMILSEIDKEYTFQTECLRFRHKKANDVYKMIVCLTVAGLFLSLYSWGLDVWAQRRADQQTSEARQAWAAELTAKEEAARKDQEAAAKASENILGQEAASLAKVFYGIHLFVEKYHYTESDMETYARCIFNRYDAGNGINSIQTIVSRADQFTGYDDRNPVQTDFKELALKFLKAWHAETSKPCDFAFQYAELTPDGIYLVRKIPAGPYDRRWHA